MRTICLAPAIALFAFTAPATAQSAFSCNDAPGFHDFDFWLGDWSVSDRATGKHAGKNRIEAIEANCALVETWAGNGGSTGMSLNLYNPVTARWRQVWVSAGGYSIDIEGGLKDGAMVLEGTIFYYGQKATIPFRGTWTAEADGSVRQYFQQYDAKTSVWNDWFDGRYERVKAEPQP